MKTRKYMGISCRIMAMALTASNSMNALAVVFDDQC
jgi:hypothetical protein